MPYINIDSSTLILLLTTANREEKYSHEDITAYIDYLVDTTAMHILFDYTKGGIECVAAQYSEQYNYDNENRLIGYKRLSIDMSVLLNKYTSEMINHLMYQSKLFVSDQLYKERRFRAKKRLMGVH